ncbi:MAG: right-handed parallel beta-helix repeat-containing protein [Acidimicrobiales bacterium]
MKSGSTIGIRGRTLGVLSVAALGLTGLVVTASPATAVDVNCGDVLTTSVTLTHDIGPCPIGGPSGGNGLVIGASDITVNLGGYSIIGANAMNFTPMEQVGVLIKGVRNVTVLNGHVRDFDAGVLINKGSKNNLRNLTVHDNVNHAMKTGTINKCNYGDGILVQGSNNNVIKFNQVHGNGPFSGISLYANSDNNIVSGNRVYDQNVANELPPAGSLQNGPCGPFSATATGVGRLYQDVGIRVEGPGADNNQVLSNQVTDNQLNGIAIHGYICWVGTGGTPPPGAPPVGSPNTGNLVQANNVRRNGFQPDGATIDGIGILRQGPFGNVTCAANSNSIIGNASQANARDGIFVPPTGDPSIPANNTVNQNTTNNNARDGVHVDGPFTVCPFGQFNPTPPNFCNVDRVPYPGSNNNTLVSNKGTGNDVLKSDIRVGNDGWDGNPSCDANVWKQNIFGTGNQPCVKANFGTGTVTGPIP